jgi:hypothetical protein
VAGLILRPAHESDHAELEMLVRATPMGSRVRMCFERDPDYFAGAAVQAEDPCVWAAFESHGRAVGLFSAGSRSVWLGGERPMRYLSDLRIHPGWQGSNILARGFRALRREVFQPGEWAQTLVLDDNSRALELLTSRRGGLPEYHPAGRYLSWLLPRQRIAPPPGIRVRRAAVSDLADMQGLLDSSAERRSFSGVRNLADLGKPGWRDLAVGDFLIAERQGSIAGIMGLWDQGGFQRLRIQGYSGALAMLRPFRNLLPGVRLPKPGHPLPMRKATAIACENDDPAILRAMLAAALAGADARLLLLGFSARDPLAAALGGLAGRRDSGHHFLVGWDGKPPEWREPFAFDAARI